jgi:hypothetical protein
MLPVQDLCEPFGNLLAEYVDESYRGEEFPLGGHHWAARPLNVALQEDWGVFSSAILTKNNALSLMEPILCSTRNRVGELLKPDTWVLRFSLQARRNEWRFWGRMFSRGTPSLSRSFEEPALLSLH